MVQPPFRLIFILLIAAVVILILPCLLFLFPFQYSYPQCGVQDDPDIHAIEKENQRQDSIQLAQDPKLKQGYSLFKEAGCIHCHDPFIKKVGPPLAKISSRRRTKWIRQAIWNFDKLLYRSDKEAVKLYNEYNQMAMPQHEFLTKDETDKIIYYLDHVKKKPDYYYVVD